MQQVCQGSGYKGRLSYCVMLAAYPLGGNVLLAWRQVFPVSWALWHEEGRSCGNEYRDKTLEEEDVAPAAR